MTESFEIDFYQTTPIFCTIESENFSAEFCTEFGFYGFLYSIGLLLAQEKAASEQKAYAVGYNMPGYMPDNEPEQCFGLDTAKELLLTDITHYLEDLNLDSRYTRDDIAEYLKIVAEVENAPAQLCNVYIGGFVFWIAEV